jgi:hypothetical protein
LTAKARALIAYTVFSLIKPHWGKYFDHLLDRGKLETFDFFSLKIGQGGGKLETGGLIRENMVFLNDTKK